MLFLLRVDRIFNSGENAIPFITKNFRKSNGIAYADFESTDEALQLKLQVPLFRFPKFYCNNIYKYNWAVHQSSIPDQFIRTPILFHTVDPANISIYSKILLYESYSNMFKETYSIYYF